MKRTYFNMISAIVLSATLLSFSAYGESIYNSNMNQQEINRILQGQTVVKSSSYKEMCVTSSNPMVQSVQSRVKKLKPAYFAEIIKEYPYKGNETLIDDFSRLVMDVPSYAGIPYYSERIQTTFDLYSWTKVLSITKNENTTIINADMKMRPFEVMNTNITGINGNDCFFYESTNAKKIKYDGIPIVSEGNMKSFIVVFRNGDKWVLYGIGAVKAPTIIGIKSRIETSFMNRIKAFCSHYCEKLQNLKK